MSSNNRTSITRLVIILVVGLLVGGGAIYLAAPSIVSPSTATQTQMQTQTQTVTTGTTVVSIGSTTSTQTTTTTSTYTATAPANVISTVSTQSATSPPPTGWQTAWANTLGISLAVEFPNSTAGPAAWNATLHPDVFITTNGNAACAVNKICTPGIAIIDAKTWQVILTRQYAIAGVTSYNEDHGLGVSYNGQYIYLGTADNTNPIAAQQGKLFIIDARTLQVHQILTTYGKPHHIKDFTLYNGTNVELIDTFDVAPMSNADPTNIGGSQWIMNPAKDNIVLGGLNAASADGPPGSAFPDPNGQELFVTYSLAPILSSESTPIGTVQNGNRIGVFNMTNWHLIKTYQSIGNEPKWVATTQNGKYSYVTDSGADYVLKIDNTQQTVVAQSRCGCMGPYGDLLNYNETMLFIASKGEFDGGYGAQIGVVNPTSMAPVNTLNIASLEPDHLEMDPWNTNLLIAGANNFEPWNPTFTNTVFNMVTLQTVATVTQTGTSHPGAFVQYSVNSGGTWTGQLLSDEIGLHGSALQAQIKSLGVTSVVYGSHSYPVVQQ